MESYLPHISISVSHSVAKHVNTPSSTPCRRYSFSDELIDIHDVCRVRYAKETETFQRKFKMALEKDAFPLLSGVFIFLRRLPCSRVITHTYALKSFREMICRWFRRFRGGYVVYSLTSRIIMLSVASSKESLWGSQSSSGDIDSPVCYRSSKDKL